MEKTIPKINERIILLSPLILDTTKPLEQLNFIDLYTSYNNYSKGFIYLLYYYTSINNFKIIRYIVRKESNFFDIKIIKYKNINYILVIFKLQDKEKIKELEQVKQFGNVGYSKIEYLTLLDYWYKYYPQIKYIFSIQYFSLLLALNKKRLEIIQPFLLITSNLFLIIISFSLYIL